MLEVERGLKSGTCTQFQDRFPGFRPPVKLATIVAAKLLSSSLSPSIEQSRTAQFNFGVPCDLRDVFGKSGSQA
jgi:hypothetical protein